MILLDTGNSILIFSTYIMFTCFGNIYFIEALGIKQTRRSRKSIQLTTCNAVDYLDLFLIR